VPYAYYPVDREENFYTVSLAELIDGVNQSIEESIENIFKRINEYLEEDFQQRVDTLFGNLNNHLSGDKTILMQSLTNKNLSLAQQAELKLQLDSFEQKATQQIDGLSTYTRRINSLMTASDE
jgi:hypothetical protein